MGFVRPIGSKKITVWGGSGILPWEAWKLLTDSSSMSKLWGDHVNFPTQVGKTGRIIDVARDFQITWPVEALEVVEGSLLKLGVIGNPWHHRPELVDSLITIKLDDKATFEMQGFDLTYLGDPSFLFASSWALSRLTSFVKACGGNPDTIGGTRAISATSLFPTEPDMIRSWILTPEKAISWLGDEINIEPRLGGHFKLKWERQWAVMLEGSITRFEPNLIAIKLAPNVELTGDQSQLVFHIQQHGSQTRLTVEVEGFDIEPWANVPLMMVSDIIQLQLASLSLELGSRSEP